MNDRVRWSRALLRRARRSIIVLVLLLATTAVGCEGAPSPFDPRTDAAARIAELGWLMIAPAAAVCVVVFAALLAALVAGRRRGAETNGATGNGAVVVGGMALPAIVIAVTLGYTIHTLREVAGVAGPGGAAAFGEHAEHGMHGATGAPQRLTAGASPLALHVTGKQWWWEVRYPDEQAVTANEIHLPAGVPIRLTVSSDDVIHSFWVPQVMGKVDVIPGKTNAMPFRVDQPGVYRGLCSEFCGLQHAHMHLLLIVVAPADFAVWVAGQRQEPAAPTNSLVRDGQRVFLRSSCIGCHTVRGTGAAGTRGPDLTHVASRRTLGAATHENTPANLASWTIDPQAMKLGNKMPRPNLSDPDARALMAYLDSLE